MPRYFIPRDKIHTTLNRLPHWQQPNATYFASWRLADSMPREAVERWRKEKAAWMQRHPEPRTEEQEVAYQTAIWRKFEAWLDAGHGSCALKNSKAGEVVRTALMYHDGDRYLQHAWVVMPNHVHTLFTLSDGWTLDRVMHTWKSFTAHQAGLQWQKSYHDRLIRSPVHFQRSLDYIRENPLSARLPEGSYGWYERIEDTNRSGYVSAAEPSLPPDSTRCAEELSADSDRGKRRAGASPTITPPRSPSCTRGA